MAGVSEIMAAGAKTLDTKPELAIKEAYVRMSFVREACERRGNEPEHEWDYTRRSLTEMNMTAVSAWLMRQRWADTGVVAELPEEREALVEALFDMVTEDQVTTAHARAVLKQTLARSCGTLETKAINHAVKNHA